ncbi:uncharacterized protein DUF397 [Nocardiopsis sp. Huas11]|uniref:DUF397 domain-containing protein n=1 Tax=Nocardiopsis sp. Huas11 TaxID=2183912 RepID=UPI000EAB636D|nr:DUF397 domain-containing protein [Nocardiopsis sp. Huas11]RKS05952.1 uncharacterized protein DUF397 [Nocardiopsis sp. Huas11]
MTEPRIHVFITWHKSSYSTNGGDCVEVAELRAETAVRDTQHRDLGHLAYPNSEWTALLLALKP